MENNIKPTKTIVLALTGASGMPYAQRLLKILLETKQKVYFLYSKAAQVVAMQESDWILPNSAQECEERLHQSYQVDETLLRVFSREDWFSPIASGSNPPDAMIICPASMGTVAAIAHGMSNNLIERAADVCLKERKPLILVPRETPLSSLHLQNLLQLSHAGATILPPVPAFYHHPQSIEDMIDFVVARVLDHLHIDHKLLKKWGK